MRLVLLTHVPRFKDQVCALFQDKTGVIFVSDLDWIDKYDYKSIPFPIIKRKATIMVIKFYKVNGFIPTCPIQLKEWGDNNKDKPAQNSVNQPQKYDWQMLVKAKEKLCVSLDSFNSDLKYWISWKRKTLIECGHNRWKHIMESPE